MENLSNKTEQEEQCDGDTLVIKKRPYISPAFVVLNDAGRVNSGGVYSLAEASGGAGLVAS